MEHKWMLMTDNSDRVEHSSPSYSAAFTAAIRELYRLGIVPDNTKNDSDDDKWTSLMHEGFQVARIWRCY